MENLVHFIIVDSLVLNGVMRGDLQDVDAFFRLQTTMIYQ
jgi:hypothetical protein